MLGKDHVAISTATVFVFLIPLLYYNVGSNTLTYFITFMIAVFIGSLAPDSDCGGKATIWYKFREIDFIMKKIASGISVLFNILVSKKKINLHYEVKKDEHRGVLHSPIGILFSSTILTFLVFIFMLFFSLFNFIILSSIFFGLLIGQFLHILEDSCTKNGINWGYPFSTKPFLKGEIKTFDKEDKKPRRYSSIFIGFAIFLTFLLSFYGIKINIFILYLLIISIIILLWSLILLLSKVRFSKIL